MKKYIYIPTIILAGIFMISMISIINKDDQDSNTTGPKFEYKHENNRIELGTIYIDELEEIILEIEFENKGNQPLILTNARGCCGTRITEFTEKPINPGETGTIVAKFRLAPRPHNISRTIIAQSNDPSGQKMLRIVGNVAERD